MDIQLYESIKYYLTNHRLPSNVPTDIQQTTLKKIHEFTLKNGKLFWIKNDMEKRVIRRNELEEVLFNIHGSQLSGHFNVEATFNRAKQNYYWPRMYREVENYVKSCDTCQRLGNKKKSNELHPIPVGRAFERVGIDIVGPLSITSKGNRYIIVATDYLTKWPEARAIQNIQAETVAQFIYEDIICRHGTPSELLSDRGTSFVNSTIKALCETMEINHVLTTSYHPQTNGLTERFNKTLCETIAKFVIQHKGEWDQYISSALLAYRTKTQKSTKFTPFFLVYGRQAQTPLTQKFGMEDNDLEYDLEDHVDLITERLHHVQGIAKENINKAQEDQKARYDKKVKPKQYQIGEQVLLRESAHENVHGDKFREKWSGPYLIHQVWKSGSYKLREIESQRILRTPINGDRLKKYWARPAWVPEVLIE
nr:8966_t:CDS:1 [Entrophospora candida]